MRCVLPAYDQPAAALRALWPAGHAPCWWCCFTPALALTLSPLALALLPCSLRVHGLIVGSPEKKRSDPAVLRGLCSHTLPSGKNEVRTRGCSDKQLGDWEGKAAIVATKLPLRHLSMPTHTCLHAFLNRFV